MEWTAGFALLAANEEIPWAHYRVVQKHWQMLIVLLLTASAFALAGVISQCICVHEGAEGWNQRFGSPQIRLLCEEHGNTPGAATLCKPSLKDNLKSSSRKYNLKSSDNGYYAL